jgi:hypothetical protein
MLTAHCRLPESTPNAQKDGIEDSLDTFLSSYNLSKWRSQLKLFSAVFDYKQKSTYTHKKEIESERWLNSLGVTSRYIRFQ